VIFDVDDHAMTRGDAQHARNRAMTRSDAQHARGEEQLENCASDGTTQPTDFGV